MRVDVDSFTDIHQRLLLAAAYPACFAIAAERTVDQRRGGKRRARSLEKRYAALHNRPDPLADGQAGEHQARVASLNGSSHATARVHPLASTTAKPPSACAALAPSRNISVIAHVDHGKVCFTHHRFPLSFPPGPDSRPSLRRRVPPFLAPPEYPERTALRESHFSFALLSLREFLVRSLTEYTH